MKYQTPEEYDAEALLLGYEYDPLDHTYMAMESSKPWADTTLDPETLELVYQKGDASSKVSHRRAAVIAGEYGFALYVNRYMRIKQPAMAQRRLEQQREEPRV